MPKVSIITPAYNPGSFLDDTVQSVINQTFTDWEMIIVDDGSTEDISYITTKHPAITLIRQENCGLSVARNTGILNSTGELLAFLDADDVWLPSKLESQVQVMAEDATAGLCHTHTDFVDDQGNRLGSSFTKRVDSYIGLLKQCTICVSSVMLRRECLSVSGLFDPLYVSVQDYDMWLKIAPYYKFAFIPISLTQYRVHDRSMSSNYLMVYEEVKSLLQRHIRHAQRHKDIGALAAAQIGLNQVRVGYGCQAFDCSRGSFNQKDWPSFRGHLRTALRLAPAHVIKSIYSNVFRRQKSCL